MKRIGYLDGIRAIAIGAVLAVHWVASQFPGAYGGYIGVDIFFVLSGYIITSLLWRQGPPSSIGASYFRFLKRRFSRLYPALLAFVAVTLVIYGVFPDAPARVGELILPAVLALTQGYSFYAASGAATTAPFAITWSLSVEWMFYLIWPLFILYAKRSGTAARSLIPWIGALAAGLYGVSLVQDSHWFYYGPLARMPEIMLGGALALMMSRSDGRLRTDKAQRLMTVGAIAALAFVACYTLLGPVQWSPVFRFFGLPATVAATLYLIWFGHGAPASRLTALLSSRPFTLIGRISYSLYLWHMVGLNLFTTENMGNLPLPLVGLLGIAAAFGMAALSYRFLERPFLRSRPTEVGTSPTAPGALSAPSQR
jgi:peptidoglycan/LPS O-acetylase OafA/YrhL